MAAFDLSPCTRIVLTLDLPGRCSLSPDLQQQQRIRAAFQACGWTTGPTEEQADRRKQCWENRPASGRRGGEVNVLAHVALRGGVEGRELHVAGVLLPHLVEHFLKGMESTVRRVHVVLIHLQGKHDSCNEFSWKL